MDICKEEEPTSIKVAAEEHYVACHLVQKT